MSKQALNAECVLRWGRAASFACTQGEPSPEAKWGAWTSRVTLPDEAGTAFSGRPSKGKVMADESAAALALESLAEGVDGARGGAAGGGAAAFARVPAAVGDGVGVEVGEKIRAHLRERYGDLGRRDRPTQALLALALASGAGGSRLAVPLLWLLAEDATLAALCGATALGLQGLRDATAECAFPRDPFRVEDELLVYLDEGGAEHEAADAIRRLASGGEGVPPAPSLSGVFVPADPSRPLEVVPLLGAGAGAWEAYGALAALLRLGPEDTMAALPVWAPVRRESAAARLFCGAYHAGGDPGRRNERAERMARGAVADISGDAVLAAFVLSKVPSGPVFSCRPLDLGLELFKLQHISDPRWAWEQARRARLLGDAMEEEDFESSVPPSSNGMSVFEPWEPPAGFLADEDQILPSAVLRQFWDTAFPGTPAPRFNVFEHDLRAAYMRVTGQGEDEPQVKRGRVERQQHPKKLAHNKLWWKEQQSPRRGATVTLSLRRSGANPKMFFDGRSHWSDSAAREAAAKAALEFFAVHATGEGPGVRFENWESFDCGAVPPRPASEGGAEMSLFGDIPLSQQRVNFILSILEEKNVRSFADIGCGRRARLVAAALIEKPGQFNRIVGVEPDDESVESALRSLDNLPVRHFFSGTAVELRHGRAEKTDLSFAHATPGQIPLDAVVMQEVVEHLDPGPLKLIGPAILGGMRPVLVVITTPNRDVNPLLYFAHRALEEEAVAPLLTNESTDGCVRSPSFDSHYDPSSVRDPDHRFEWSAAEFEAWAQNLADTWGYGVEFRSVGFLHPCLASKAMQRAGGALGDVQMGATQAALFTRLDIAHHPAQAPAVIGTQARDVWPLAKEWSDVLSLRREVEELKEELRQVRGAALR